MEIEKLRPEQKRQLTKEIIEAYVFLREKNHSIPSDTLDFIKENSLKALDCEHPYIYVYRKMDFEKCNKCGKILCDG